MATQLLGPAGLLLITEGEDSLRLPVITGGSTNRPASTTSEIRFVNERLDPPQSRTSEAIPGTASFTYIKSAAPAIQALHRLEDSNDETTFTWVSNDVVEVATGSAGKTLAIATPTSGNKSIATFVGNDLTSATLRASGRFLVVGTQAFAIGKILTATTAEVYLVGDVAANVVTPDTTAGRISSAVAATPTWDLVTPAEVIEMRGTVTAAGNSSFGQDQTDDTLEIGLTQKAVRKYWVAESQNISGDA